MSCVTEVKVKTLTILLESSHLKESGMPSSGIRKIGSSGLTMCKEQTKNLFFVIAMLCIYV